MIRDYAPAYIRGNFEPGDRLAAVLINKRTGSVIQRLSTAEQMATPEFQDWLRSHNQERYDIYISMNSLREDARGRTKGDIAAIRHVYLDFDKDGNAAVQALFQRRDLPVASYVVNTSPNKWHVIWIVENFERNQAEQLQRGLARQTGADIAATDCSRVLRLPGFANHKYGRPYFVRAEAHSTIARYVYTPENFPQFLEDRTFQRPPCSSAKPSPGELSQSEHDWAYAKRALSRGERDEHVIATIASYRRFDKHNPQYYAELTVHKAAESLRTEQARSMSPDQHTGQMR